MWLFSSIVVIPVVLVLVVVGVPFSEGRSNRRSESGYPRDDSWVIYDDGEGDDVGVADVSKIPYGESLALFQTNIPEQNDHVSYTYLSKSYASSFDLARFLSINAYRQACLEAGLAGDGTTKCWKCVNKISKVTTKESAAWGEAQVGTILSRCFNRYLENSRFKKCGPKIDEEKLLENPDDKYITLPYFSPELRSYIAQGIGTTPPLDQWVWLLPSINFYRCLHSKFNSKGKRDCAGDSACISALFDRSMTTLPTKPDFSKFKPIPIDQRVKGYDAKLQESELKRHNELRALHGVPPLKLDDDIIVYAQEYANVLAAKSSFDHNVEKDKFYGYGENLGTINPPYGYKGTVSQGLYDEIKYYDFTDPEFIGKENPQKENGHFIQVVWKTSRKVGFGIARYPDGTGVVVANYDPPGNVNVVPGGFTSTAKAKENLRASVLPLCSKQPHPGCGN